MERDGLNRRIVWICLVITSILCVADRLSQIIYLATTNFVSITVRNTCITFLILLPATNIFMMILYLFSSHERETKTKIKNFFKYILFTEICYAPGANYEIQTKYEENEPQNISTYIITTQKVLNVLHVMFISLPQLLIVTIHSSSVGRFYPIDIASLFFSCLFIFWSIIYYIVCIRLEDVFDEHLTEIYG
jgi:hypothetical protein